MNAAGSSNVVLGSEIGVHFEASAFGISLPEGSWKVVNYGTGNKRAIAVTQVGGTAFVLAPREGGRDALEKYLGTLH